MSLIHNLLQNLDKRLILTLITILAIWLVRWLLVKLVSKHIITKNFSKEREDNIVKIINFSSSVAFVISQVMIWGLKSNDILFYLSSTLTVVGVAFFAQWSILSNITAGIVFFLYGNLKIGSHIKIIDKDMPMEGTIISIGIFFTILEIEPENRVSIPNSLLMQKSISYK